MKYIFLRNPAAGSKIGQEAFDKIQTYLKDNSDCEFYVTTHPGHATEVAVAIGEKYGEDAVIFACGGDGTLSEVATGLDGYNTAIALIPMGTGNDFAKKIYGDLTLDEIISGFGIPSGKPSVKLADIDCINANGARCINVMSLGFDTKVLKIANKISAKLPWMGGAAYKLALVLSLFGGFRFDARFSLDVIGEEGKVSRVEEDKAFILCAICNGSYYGGGFCPAKDSLINDGVLDILVAKNLNLIQVLGMIGHYIKGDVHITHPHLVKRLHITGGTISSVDSKPLSFNRDGNPTEANEVEFEIRHNELKLAYFENDSIKASLK